MKMKRTKGSHLLIALLSMVSVLPSALPADGQAAAIPDSVRNILQQRQSAFTNQELIWKLDHTSSMAASSPAAIAEMEKQAVPQDKQQMELYYGTTNQKDIDAQVKAEVELMRGFSVQTSSEWDWSNYGPLNAITGSWQDSLNLATSFRYYFSDDWGMYVNTKTVDPQTHTAVFLNEPYVWANVNGVFSCPLITIYYIEPSDGVFLFGRDPFKVYPLSWRLVNKTATTISLAAVVTKNKDVSEHYSLSLDILHGLAPALLKITSYGDTAEYQVVSWEKLQNVWIPRQVKYTENGPAGRFSSSKWSLTAHKPSPPITIQLLKNRQMVADYRLLGLNQDSDSLIKEALQPNTKVVWYQWHGSLPSLAQLEQMDRDSNPGEGTPDPSGKESMIPIIGGFACLVGGILIFRRRGKVN